MTEQALRRRARKQGYVLKKNRTRNRNALDFGLFALVESEAGGIVHKPLPLPSGEYTMYALTLEDAGAWLDALGEDDVPADYYFAKLRSRCEELCSTAIATLESTWAVAYMSGGEVVFDDSCEERNDEIHRLSASIGFCERTLMGALGLVRIGMTSFLSDVVLESDREGRSAINELKTLIKANDEVDELCLTVDALERELAAATDAWESMLVTTLLHNPWLRHFR